jgi:Ni2+-binding GTPase involved in maturation of urease and hydrogenase
VSPKPKMFFVGGFLGAGKTTAIQSLARMFARRGVKAAAITNDQATGLVDTLFLTNSGVPAEEVAGSCFCCNFNGLAEAIKLSVSANAPDVILAEPVGSCTDIVATVVRPMRYLLQDKVEVLAYSVLVEPDRWLELSGNSSSWSMKYLFEKQLLEADFIVVTKLDTLAKERAQELMAQVARQYLQAKVVGISAMDGTGMENWLDLVQTTPPGEHWLRDIDYQRYAAAEAEMGWLNGSLNLNLPRPRDGKVISGRLGERFEQGIRERHGGIGHLKLLVVGLTGSAKVSVTYAGQKPVVDGAFTGPAAHFQVTVNIRATLSPEELTDIVHDTLGYFRENDQAEADISALNAFRPGAPKPTYRYRESSG